MNRLTSATDSGGWSRNFGFDAFGNMWVPCWTGIAPAGNMAQSNVYNANNQISGGTYDQAGDQTNVGGNTLNYDYEGHVVAENDGVSKAVEIYVYDGDGRRVEKYVQGGSARTVFVYDAQGLLAAEYSTTANSSPCLTCYLSPDHLGTARLVTDQNGNVVARHDYLPFGEEIAASTAGRDGSFGPGNDSVRQKFTGKERDSESGLDYFAARYYGSGLGRWTSPDSVNLTDERIVSPADTFNKYVYGADNPMKYVDPDGRDITLFYDHGGPAGHFILYAFDPSNGNSAVHSFGPVDHSLLSQLEEFFDIPVAGKNSYALEHVESADYLRQHYASFTLQTNPEDTEKAIAIIKNSKASNYLTYARNCTTTCADILRKFKLHQFREIIPQALFYDFAGEHGNDNIPYPAQNGVEYGRPRTGYNAFNSLFLTLKTCHTETATWIQNGITSGTTTLTVCN